MALLSSNLLINRRLLAVLCLGFSSGLPLALIGSTLQAWFTEAHINLVTIGALSLIGVPYTLKFLWAPIMDHYGLAKIGKHKTWILLTQAGLVLMLAILAQMDPTQPVAQMSMIALAIAFFSASQDVSITAYQTDILAPEERGMGAAYYVFAYRVAMLIAGGFALICADYVGWKLTYEVMAALLLLSMVATCCSPRAVEYTRTTNQLSQTILASLKDLLMREKILWVLLFIVLYKFGDALALSVDD